MEDLGFNTGKTVIVTIEHGRLVIETELRFWLADKKIPAFLGARISLLTIYKTKHLSLLFHILHLLFRLSVAHRNTLDQPSF
ncbi:type I toxin-antitoxin system SymE family toxin [Pectobacterium brasiliense]|uniref:type I toxin-antitoxin system SymE family toxin n=1 Tax=Pectobacterium brasiliense TaxID=180957 RepID=UPI001F0B2B78|nr:type I toxin-antitoxin system SymE family toxin [Pectobacterium brasiliense]